MNKLIRPFYMPKNHKINFLLLNSLAIIATLILWIKDSNYFGMDITFPIFPYLFFSIFCIIVSFYGFHGYIVSYFYGLVCFVLYIFYLWQAIDSRKMGIDTFIMTLYLYPFLLPPFPFFSSVLTLAIDGVLKWKANQGGFQKLDVLLLITIIVSIIVLGIVFYGIDI